MPHRPGTVCQPSRTSEHPATQLQGREKKYQNGCSTRFQEQATPHARHLPLVTPSTSSAGGDSSATPAARSSRPTDRVYCSKRCMAALVRHADRAGARRQTRQRARWWPTPMGGASVWAHDPVSDAGAGKEDGHRSVVHPPVVFTTSNPLFRCVI